MQSIKPNHWVLLGLLGAALSDLRAQTPAASESQAQLEPATQEQSTPIENKSEGQGPGLDKETAVGSELANATPKDDEVKFGPSFRVEVTHSVGAKTDVDPVTVLNLTGRYRINNQVTLSASQRVSKLYNVDPEEDEVQLADTSLRVNSRLIPESTGLGGIGIAAALDATLPISQFSQDQKLTTVLGSQVTATRTFGVVSTLLRPFYRYHVNQYKTLLKDDSGATVVRYRLGILFDVTLELPKDLSLSSSNQWVERHYEDPPYGSRSPDHDYSFDLSLSYAPTKETSFSVGYNESNRAEQLGVVSVNLFDVETSSYFVSASREF